MKRLWKEISEAHLKPNKNFVGSTFFVISIFLMSCTQKRHDAKPEMAKPELELRNERPYTPEETETTIFSPSGFHYDNIMKTTNAEDEYNDRLDDYLDDPEDELRFDPEIFDFQDE